MTRLLALALSTVAALVGLTTVASAATTFTVNQLGEFPDTALGDNVCDTITGTAGSQCTLPAAIQQANATAGADTINFNRSAAGLGPAPTISLVASLPAITERVKVSGGNCGTAVVPAPCVGIDGNNDRIGFTASAANVAVSGLAIGDFNGVNGVAIRLASDGSRLTVRNTWLGRTLAGGDLPNGTGVLLEGTDARIGGTTPTARNVIANSEVVGVRIFKGDSNHVLGNYFGTDETGNPGTNANTDALLLEGDLSGSAAGTPAGNVIGGTVTGPEASSDRCDGACNLIVNSSDTGIDLRGTPGLTSAAGANTIRGNHVGLNLGGVFANPNFGSGIDVGGAHGVVIGGAAAGDRNFIAGNNSFGIVANDGVVVRNNFLGIDVTGTDSVENTGGSALLSGDASDPVVFDRNRVGGSGSGGVAGLILDGSGGSVTANILGVGTGGEPLPLDPAIQVVGNANTIGGAGAGNVIGNAFDPGSDPASGIELSGSTADDNTIAANRIGIDEANGDIGNEGAAIRIGFSADGNAIGGNAADQNVISNNGGDAISVPGGGLEGQDNVFARNRGSANGGAFIDLGVDGQGNFSGVNGGVEAPQLTAATADAAGGTAQPGSVVRVFAKNNASAGELGAFLGKTTTDGAGNWILACPSAQCPVAPSVGDLITASQTGASGESQLASPVIANDGELEVDATDDQGDLNPADGECFTLDGSCTLRAAIEQSDASAGVQTVSFDTAAMGADPTIVMNSSLAVAQRVTIRGCAAPSVAPCVGLRPLGGGSNGLAIAGESVAISGLALSGFSTALSADASADGLAVRGSWFGLELDQTPATNSVGLELRGDDASIGGTSAGQRNVFASNSNVNLRILGGDSASIRGNYFGTMPNGTSVAPNSGTGIAVQRNTSLADPALDNAVGDTVAAASTATPACDGGCNVISPEFSNGIDLGSTGADDAAVRTAIRGNFVGLRATGNGALSSGTGIAIFDGRETTVGGPALGDRNYLAGASNQDVITALAGGTVRNNFVGLNSSGTNVVGGGGLALEGDASEPVVVRDNRIAGTSFGLRLRGSGGTVAGNVLGVKPNGALAPFTQESIGLAGADYTVGGTTDAARNVIAGAGFSAELQINGFGDLANGDDNRVIGNFIGTDASGADLGGTNQGIQISNSAQGNVIGGTSEAGENVISHEAAAINVVTSGAQTDGNEIRRNRGFDNSSRFIVLSSGNDGIGFPTLNTVTQSAASGFGARPNATIRAYLTFDETLSGIRRFLGQADADGSGTFSVGFADPLPAGACVAVTQTDPAGNSSELAGPVAVGGGGCDTVGPATTFDSGPTIPQPTTDTTPTFHFHADEPGSSFECRIDDDPFAKCRTTAGTHTPAVPLALGDHVLRVRATDPIGNTGPIKARNFRIVAP